MILSSYSNFMAHFMEYNSSSGVANFGIMGGVTEVPPHYQVATMSVYIAATVCYVRLEHGSSIAVARESCSSQLLLS